MVRPSKKAMRVFFYGSFMDPGVLMRRLGRSPRMATAVLRGWAIEFGRYANMRPETGSSVWGTVGRLSRKDLKQLYDDSFFGATYAPVEVSIRSRDEDFPAVTYVSRRTSPARPDGSYLEDILRIARRRRFSARYIARLEKAAGRKSAR